MDWFFRKLEFYLLPARTLSRRQKYRFAVEEEFRMAASMRDHAFELCAEARRKLTEFRAEHEAACEKVLAEMKEREERIRGTINVIRSQLESTVEALASETSAVYSERQARDNEINTVLDEIKTMTREVASLLPATPTLPEPPSPLPSLVAKPKTKRSGKPPLKSALHERP